jgi:hypothetical protein
MDVQASNKSIIEGLANPKVEKIAEDVAKAGTTMAETGSKMQSTPELVATNPITASAPIRKSFAAFNQGA